MNTPIKPIIIAKEEVRVELVSVINDIISTYQLPFFILEPIVKDVYNEIARKAELEYKQAYEQYQIELTEKTKSEN